MTISIIIPTINEETALCRLGNFLQGFPELEIIVADGGSTDQTIAVAQSRGFLVVTGAQGRGPQMNLGATLASRDNLLFLHCDTQLPLTFASHVQLLLSQAGVVAGAFRLAIAAPGWGYRVIEFGANLRSTLFDLPYGDQAIFLRRRVFEQIGGYPDQPIMEDFAMLRRLATLGRIAIAPVAATTSARRWQRLGLWRATLVNQMMIIGYLSGLDPGRLAHFYYRSKQRRI